MQADPDLACTLGDTIMFVFPVDLPTHPFSIYTTAGALFPGVTGTPFRGVGNFTFRYDAVLHVIDVMLFFFFV
jgi:hypothetical protein